MCGIVGVAGDIGFKHEKALKTLLIVDSLRGTDSTGIAAVDKDLDVTLAKQVGDPFILMESVPFNKVMQQRNVAIIGHNRYATQGVVNRKNAHPFEFDKLVGVHNGTLTNKYRLDESHKYPVDSENLYFHMDKHGVLNTIPIIQGAWSLVWWNKEECTLNFLRNKERPMFIAFSKDEKVLFWASEAWMINVATYRAEVEIGKIEETAVDSHVSYLIDKNGNIEPQDIKEIKGGIPPVFQGGRGTLTIFDIPPKQNKQENTSVTPTGKVVYFPEKEEEKDIPIHYIGAKQRTLEVFAGGIDEHGARYLTCFDEAEPTAHIRLYVRQSDNTLNLINTSIIADIGKLYKSREKTYFKVEYGSVKRVVPKLVHKDRYGSDIDKDTWTEKYGICRWCTTPIFPTDKFTFLKKEYGALCEDCSNDPEVKQYL
jgi:predicted glutamine amidotransferase